MPKQEGPTPAQVERLEELNRMLAAGGYQDARGYPVLAKSLLEITRASGVAPQDAYIAILLMAEALRVQVSKEEIERRDRCADAIIKWVNELQPAAN
jgi:hypothetical protein